MKKKKPALRSRRKKARQKRKTPRKNSKEIFEEIKQAIADINPKILLADGFEDALVGYVEIFNKTLALYDQEKCIKILIERDGMGRDEAEEFFSFNVQGAFLGELTPGFATFLRH